MMHVALAQGIAGTEEEFVNMMNSMAKNWFAKY